MLPPIPLSVSLLPRDIGSDIFLIIKQDDNSPDSEAIKKTMGNALSRDAEVMFGDGDPVRALVCNCEGRTYWSVACRLSKSDKDIYKTKRAGCKDDPPFSPIGLVEPKSSAGDGPVSIARLVEEVSACLTDFSSGGLIVVAGATSAGKSELAAGILYDRVMKTRPGEMRHVLTVETPVLKGAMNIGTERDARLIWVTRRGLGNADKDAKSLAQILDRDARRQKPAAVLVDEVRDDEEWKCLIDFALTRHLVITTTHASHLNETIARIARGIKCKTEMDWARLGRALLGVIHLSSDVLEADARSAAIKTQYSDVANDSYKVIVPTLWRRTKPAIAGLAHPGLSSIVPRRAKDTEEDQCLGRAYFALKFQKDIAENCSSDIATEVETWAATQDLEEY
jgi:hypothetical protein